MARKIRPITQTVVRHARPKPRPQQGALPAKEEPSKISEGEAIIHRLNSYLLKVEGLIQTMDLDDPRSMLLAIDQARKTCETLAKLYLDIIKAQIDVKVQNEFRQIVLDAINSTAPDVRQRIVSEIRSRAATCGVLGGYEEP